MVDLCDAKAVSLPDLLKLAELLLGPQGKAEIWLAGKLIGVAGQSDA